MVTKALGSMYPWILDTRYLQESVVIPYKIILITEYTILNVETTFEYLSHTLWLKRFYCLNRCPTFAHVSY